MNFLATVEKASWPLLGICQWRGHQEKGTQLGGGDREKWELVWPKKVVSLNVGILNFGILRHNFLYISSTRQRFVLPCFAYIVDKRDLHWMGEGQPGSQEGPKQGVTGA